MLQRNPWGFAQFNNKNLVTFEGIILYKGDLPLVAYMDFETTAPSDNCFNPEQNKMFLVSYVIAFAFHPKLNLDRVVVQRSFGHSLKKNNNYRLFNQRSDGMYNVKLVSQLKDCAICVSQKSVKMPLLRCFALSLNL